MAPHCLALDRNYPSCIMFDFFSGTTPFGLYLYVYMNFGLLCKVGYISLQHADTTNSHNWAASTNLISPSAIIFARGLICSSVVLPSSLIALTCFWLESMNGSTLGTYVVIDLWSPERSA